MDRSIVTDEKREKVEPMKIFLSYGHPESEIVDRIADELRKRGHEVWIDSTELPKKGNADWREEITRGIEGSQKVVACLSKHSVRDPGVCLNELAIAVGVKGGNIASVLLEDEKKVSPLPSICHIQWLNMSLWKEKQDAGDEVFNIWFNERAI